MRLAWPVALLLAGCATSTPVHGPDGEPGWYAIDCRRSQSECIEEAGNVCPHGYIIADSSGSQGAMLLSSGNSVYHSTTVVPTYRGSMLIKCKTATKHVEARTPAPPKESPSPTCESAYRNIEDLVGLWADWYQREPAGDPPARGPFVHVCSGLSEDVQVCLVPAYATAHREPCLASLHAYPETRAKLDALLSRQARSGSTDATPAAP